MNIIQGECTKCNNTITLNSFIHIISIKNEKYIKHLISDNDFCPRCNSYFSIKISCLELISKSKIEAIKIYFKKIKLINEDDTKNTLINLFLKK